MSEDYRGFSDTLSAVANSPAHIGVISREQVAVGVKGLLKDEDDMSVSFRRVASSTQTQPHLQAAIKEILYPAPTPK
jgi:hypothetical protein